MSNIKKINGAPCLEFLSECESYKGKDKKSDTNWKNTSHRDDLEEACRGAKNVCKEVFPEGVNVEDPAFDLLKEKFRLWLYAYIPDAEVRLKKELEKMMEKHPGKPHCDVCQIFAENMRIERDDYKSKIERIKTEYRKNVVFGKRSIQTSS